MVEQPSNPAAKRQPAPATNQELTAARARHAVARDSPGPEFFKNRKERRIGFLGVGLFVVVGFGLFRRGPLAVVGSGSMLAKKVFI